MKKLACLFLLLAAGGCPSIEVDPFEEETRGSPVVEFDPANRIVPFPNNLLLDPATGRVNLPAQCGETPTAKALRENVLNQLDGFGAFESALTVTFTEGVDMASLADKVVVYKRASGTTPADPATATALPIVTQVTTTVRFDASCATPSTIPQLIIIPRVPLEQKSTYVVGLLSGIKSTGGVEFAPSGTFRLIRGTENPVTVVDGRVVADRTPLDPADPEDHARLVGIDGLWKAHAQGLKFLADDLPADKRKPRDQILLAWEFRTQTTTDPLDPTVAGSLAASVNTLGLQQVATRTGPATGGPAGETAEQFLQRVLPPGTCTAIPCAAVGDVLGGGLVSKSYLSESPNPVAGTCMAPDFLGCPVRGQWADPVAPAVVKPAEIVETLVVTPQAACPAAGCPTVIFAHAIGQSKTNAFALAPQLAQRGFATVAIDAVAHDSRAIRISNDAARGCGGPRPSPLTAPQCFAPFLSPNLGAARDNIRQTVLDYHGLIAALKSCNATPCGGFKPDLTKLYYVGQSLGGILGGMTVATSSDLKGAVLNVAGVGWADILENTQTNQLRCPLVDGLIDAGILQGEKSNLAATPPTGLCTMEAKAWQDQPGYRQFRVIGRWVLDPADPANFTVKLRARKVLLQEVVGDTVVPNLATANEGMLLGLMPGTADPIVPPPPAPAPSAVIATNPMSSKWVRYPMVAPNGGTGFPGNVFGHSSLLQPPVAGPAASLGVLRMQTDAISFLLLNP